MSTVKFDFHDQLDELQAKLYLDTKIKITKKEILELAFKIGSKDYERLLKMVLVSKIKTITKKQLDEVLSLAEDFGLGTENLSQEVDEILYDLKKG